MKFTKIRLSGLTDVDLPLLGATPEDIFICKGIDGLGPTENDVTITNGHFQGSVARDRQVICKVGLNPDYSSGETPSDLRELIYSLLTGGYTGNEVSIIVMDDDPSLINPELCWTDGARISKMEANQFSKDPEVVITLECLGPYLTGSIEQPTLAGMSLSAPSFDNVGTAPTGIHMKFTTPVNLEYIKIKTAGDLKNLRFNIFDVLGFKTAAGDTFEFDTTPGNRYAQITHSAVVRNLLSTMSTDSEWFQLYGGTNSFTFDATMASWIDISYVPQYLGV